MSVLPFDSPAAQRFLGERVIFTGKLSSLSRKDARVVVSAQGGETDDEVTPRSTLLVLGAETYPDGSPDPSRLPADQSTHGHKLRRAAQINAEGAGHIRIVTEDEFCGMAGLPTPTELRQQHYSQRDILGMYPELREDHLRYLQKWGFIRAVHRNNADKWYGFSDLTLLRSVRAELQKGVPFRAVLRDLQASRSGQLAFDFRIDAPAARILTLKPRERPQAPPAAGGPAEASAISSAEQYFLMASLLDDGAPEQQEQAAQAYRRALAADPTLVAAIINLANIRYARDELAEAQALYERAITLDPSYFEAHFNLGNIHHDHSMFADAEVCYRSAIALNPTYADAHFYLAVTLEKMGRSADARVHWQAYQRLAPKGEWVELAREFSD